MDFDLKMSYHLDNIIKGINQFMGNSAKKATLEDLQEIIRDIGKSQQKTEESLREVAEAQKETEESFREVAEAQKETEAAQQKTEESLREVAKAQKETKAAQQKTEESLREVTEAQKETEVAQQKTEVAQQKTEIFLRDLGKKIDKVNGDLTNKWGRFIENLVEGDLVNLLAPWDIKVNKVQPNLRYSTVEGIPKGEFDLVAINSTEVVVIEVKSTLKDVDIGKLIGKLKKFKEFFPEYKDKMIYGGVAYLRATKEALERAKNEGLFIIKAPGGECKISTITNEKGFKPTEF